MKSIVTGILAFGLGAAVTHYVCTAVRRADESKRRSGIEMPMGQMIAAINQDLRANRVADAQAKLQFLEQQWLKFCHGGPAPEEFYAEVLATVAKGNQPTNQIHGVMTVESPVDTPKVTPFQSPE